MGFLVQQKSYSNKKHERTPNSLLFLDMIEQDDNKSDYLRPSTSKTTLYSSKPSTRPATRNLAKSPGARSQTSILTRVNTASKHPLRPLFSSSSTRPGTTHKPREHKSAKRSPPLAAGSLHNLAGVFPSPKSIRDDYFGSSPIDFLLSAPQRISVRGKSAKIERDIGSPAPSMETIDGGEVIGDDRTLVFLHMSPVSDGESGGMPMLDLLVGRICNSGYVIGLCSKIFAKFRVDYAKVCPFQYLIDL